MCKPEYKIIYPIGIRCTTELALQKLNLKKHSSIFGSIYIKQFENIIKCIDSNFDILLNKDNNISTDDIGPTEKFPYKYPYSRTINKYFDITDWYYATFAHHDIVNNNNHLQHFIRGVERFNKIKSSSIPTLFINISHSNEFDNTQNTDDIVNVLVNTGWSNFHAIFIYFNGQSDKKINKFVDSNKTIIMINDSIFGGVEDEQIVADYLKIILDDYNLQNMLSYEDINGLL